MVPAVCLLLAITFTPVDDDAAELVTRVERLEAAVERLEAAHDPDRWLTAQRAREVRALVGEVLADADTRSAHLVDSATAGWSDDFFIKSGDGDFLAQPFVLLQVRFAFNHRDNVTEEDLWGFTVRRLRIGVRGHVIDPSWTYQVQVGNDLDIDGLDLHDAYVTKTLGGGWSIRAGQFKLPFTRERDVSVAKQLASERSLVDTTYRLDRSTGVQVKYHDERWRLRLVASNGEKAINVGALTPNTKIAITGRGEYLVGGSWDRLEELTSPPGAGRGALLGLAAHYQKADEDSTSPDDEFFAVTADATIDLDGTSVFASFLWRHVVPVAVAAPEQDQLAVVVDVAHYLTETWEGFLRYEWSDYDAAGVPDLSILTVGLTKYFSGQAVRWTTDLGYGFNEVAAVFTTIPRAGWLTDAPGEDGQVVLRSQLQILF